jgi:branched-chain amino acid transport system ATP-binding protein
MSLLQVRDLAKSFGGVKAVDGVSFDLQAGQMLSLIGPNGAGKSTCFNLVNGQLRPDRGSIRLKDQEITGLAPRRIWRLGVGRTFQVAATFGSMSVLENVQMALLSRQRRLYHGWRPVAAYDRHQAIGLLEQVGMTSQADRPCNALAYGDLKRAELAMALAHEPELLLMDEPTSGMVPAERSRLMGLVRRLVAERNLAVLFTEHSMQVVFEFADSILVMARGRVIAQGSADQIRLDPTVREVYFGGPQRAARVASGLS